MAKTTDQEILDSLRKAMVDSNGRSSVSVDGTTVAWQSLSMLQSLIQKYETRIERARRGGRGYVRVS